jgi:hypothetical protein
VGNLLARRGDRQHADAVYRLALRLWPASEYARDPTIALERRKQAR